MKNVVVAEKAITGGGESCAVRDAEAHLQVDIFAIWIENDIGQNTHDETVTFHIRQVTIIIHDVLLIQSGDSFPTMPLARSAPALDCPTISKVSTNLGKDMA